MCGVVVGVGEALSTIMVRTLFTWCHGGRQVFLCASFRGWTEHIQMSMVEGSPMVFQTICDLPPGYHKYKFLVDGEWRFDDQQFCVPDEFGTINNVILVGPPELSSLTLPAEASRPSMNMDNIGIVRHTASSSNGVYRERVMQFSDNEIDVSRQRLLMHLSSYRTYELIPTSNKVIALDVKVAVKEAFHVMHEQGLAVVPLWDDARRQILGMLTASDFILILVKEQLDMHTISAWKDLKLHLRAEAVGGQVFRGPLIQADPDESLRDMAIRIVEHKISAVPIIDSTKDGHFPRLLHIACLAGILNHICRHFRHNLNYLPLLQQPVGGLPLGSWREVGTSSGRQLLMLRPSDPLRSALHLLLEVRISSIPIIDDEGALINVYSQSDVTSLIRGNVYAHIHLDQTTISQALELVDGANHNRYRTCTRSDSLYSIMELLSNPVVRRVIVIDAGSRRVEDIITLRDVFNFIMR